MKRVKYLTAGESHGKEIYGIIEGVPAGLEISSDDFDNDMRRRREGIGRSDRMKVEDSRVQILSGIRKGKSTGAPICLGIENKVHEKWFDTMRIEKDDKGKRKLTNPRPGHADYAGMCKFNLDDARDVIERASARETAMRCALGVIAKKFLKRYCLELISRTLSIAQINFQFDEMYPCAQSLEKGIKPIAEESSAEYEKKISELENLKRQLLQKGDSCGGSFQLIAHKIPIGLGSYTQAEKRIDSLLAQAIMSIPSVKAVSIGAGIESSKMCGSEFCDEFKMNEDKFFRKSNHAGGVEGGITNGEPLIITGFVKPVPSISSPMDTIDLTEGKITDCFHENADIWVVEAIGVISESVTALVLMDAFLEKFGGDSISEIDSRFNSI